MLVVVNIGPTDGAEDGLLVVAVAPAMVATGIILANAGVRGVTVIEKGVSAVGIVGVAVLTGKYAADTVGVGVVAMLSFERRTNPTTVIAKADSNKASKVTLRHRCTALSARAVGSSMGVARCVLIKGEEEGYDGCTPLVSTNSLLGERGTSVRTVGNCGAVVALAIVGVVARWRFASACMTACTKVPALGKRTSEFFASARSKPKRR